MKTTFALLILLTTTFVFADDFSAKSLTENDDGTISVSEPFIHVTDESRDVSLSASESSGVGVCKAYGFGKFLNLFADKKRKPDYAVVSSSGKLLKVATRRQIKSSGGSKHVIKEIICSLDSSVRLSRTSMRAQTFVPMELGSVKIVNPQFGQIGGKIRGVSSTSNLSGFCKLFGYERAYAESLKTSAGKKGKNVILGRDGRFSSLESGTGEAIESMVCGGELMYRLSPNFHPRGLDKTLNAIIYASKPFYANYLKSTLSMIDKYHPIEPSESRVFPPLSALTPAEKSRILQVLLLDSLFRNMSSPWFSETVMPAYEEQKTEIQSHYGAMTAKDWVKTQADAVLLVSNVVSAIDSMAKEVHSTEASKWLYQVKSKAGSFMSAAHPGDALKPLIETWDSGSEYIDQVRGNRSLEGLVATLELCMELLKGMK